MPTIPSPHDRFFKSAMSDMRVAKAFFQAHLPDTIRQQINIETLSFRKDSFIDEQLQLAMTDMLYAVDFAHQRGYLYLLTEHQSTPNYWMPFRLVKYIFNIMDHHLKQTNSKYLPIVYPLVFYHGATTYSYSTDIFDLFSEPDLAKSILLQPFQLIDIQAIPDAKLKENVWAGVLELCMKHVFARDILPHLKEMFALLAEVEQAGGMQYIVSALTYLYTTSQTSDRKTMIKLIQANLTDEVGRKVMTIAEEYKAEGKAEGKIEGIAEGKAAGKAEATRDIARKLIAEGMPLAKINLITGLSQQELQTIKDGLEPCH